MNPDDLPPSSLAGVRVLDLSRILAGPTATQLLADLGAEVIKVEKPGSGDDTRSWGPPYVANDDGSESDLSGYFLCANRNKRSIAIDLATEDGVALVKRLAAISDIVVENYKPGDLDRRGIGYEALKLIKPDLIWCSISGFGQTGPNRDRVGYDFLVQAMGGLMSVTGDPDADGGHPLKVGVGIADVMCGMYASVGLLAALRHRDRTGCGQHIDIALFDSQVAWLINAATNHLVSGKVPTRLGNRHPNIAPYQSFTAGDETFVIAVGNDGQFAKLAHILGKDELASDPRFLRNRDRVDNIDVLDPILTELFSHRPASEWIDLLTAAGVPAGPVASIDQVLASDQVKQRNMVVEIAREDGPPIRVLGNPLKLTATPVRYDRAPPSLDRDRDYVLHDLLGDPRQLTGREQP